MSTIQVHHRRKLVANADGDLEHSVRILRDLVTQAGGTVLATEYEAPHGAARAAVVRYSVPYDCGSLCPRPMTWPQVKRDWNSLGQHFQRRWDKLSDLDLRAIGGRRGELIDRLRQLYSMDRAHAEREADDFIRMLP